MYCVFCTVYCTVFYELSCLTLVSLYDVIVLQAIAWVMQEGETYLSSRGGVGERQSQTEALLKEHHEFKGSAKVRVIPFTIILPHRDHVKHSSIDSSRKPVCDRFPQDSFVPLS